MTDAWKFSLDSNPDCATLKATPDYDVLQKKISEGAAVLSEKIMRYEEQLLLSAMSTEALVKLFGLVKGELEIRAERTCRR